MSESDLPPTPPRNEDEEQSPEDRPASPPPPPSSAPGGTRPDTASGAASGAGGAGGGAAAPPPPSSPPPGPAGGTGGGAASRNRGVMIVLSYLGILALIPLFIEKEDREVQWHAKHGLVLFGAEIVIMVVAAIFFAMLAMFDAGCGGCIFNSLFFLAVLVLHIACIVKGLNGERLIVPGLSPLADRF